MALTPLWYKFVSERPNDTYVKMKEINDNQSLIGLSKNYNNRMHYVAHGNTVAEVIFNRVDSA